MILVDTSVWIRAFMNQAPFASKLRWLTVSDQVSGHEFVYGELLIGDRGGRKVVLASYEQIPWVTTATHAEVVTLVRERGLHGRGVSWIDVHLLASALNAKIPLWTADETLADIAAELGVAYRP